MRAHHRAAPDIDGRRDDLVRPSPIEEPARRHDVRHRVHRADFVEMYLADFPSVRPRLRLGEQRVDLAHAARDVRRQRKSVDDRQHVIERTVLVAMRLMLVVVTFVAMVVMMITVMVFFARRALLVAVHEDREMRRGDAAFRKRTRLEDDARNADGVELRESPLPVAHEFQERTRDHVAGRTHLAVEIKCLHFFAPIWLIRLARNPAPKPLSMFTTLTPAAHEFSIARSAVTPPKAAP